MKKQKQKKTKTEQYMLHLCVCACVCGCMENMIPLLSETTLVIHVKNGSFSLLFGALPAVYHTSVFTPSPIDVKSKVCVCVWKHKSQQCPKKKKEKKITNTV